LTTHIKDIVNLLFYEDLWNVILVGHSYAGMVITGVASEVPQRLRQLVYLDAYLPEPGQSEFDLWPPDWQAQARGDIAAGKTTREPLPPSAFGIDDPKMAEWLAARLTPQNLATYDEPTPPANPSGSALVRTYIRCTKGPFVSLTTTFAANAKRKGWEVSELATGHDVMLTMPQELADVLHKLAT
jgi:pimeloyl-ACP methyl ester carboxylesterase